MHSHSPDTPSASHLPCLWRCVHLLCVLEQRPLDVCLMLLMLRSPGEVGSVWHDSRSSCCEHSTRWPLRRVPACWALRITDVNVAICPLMEVGTELLAFVRPVRDLVGAEAVNSVCTNSEVLGNGSSEDPLLCITWARDPCADWTVLQRPLIHWSGSIASLTVWSSRPLCGDGELR